MIKLSVMKRDKHEQLREYVNRWKETAKFLENLRREEIRSSDLAESIGVFDNAFRSAIWLDPAGKTSGLIEFHKILAKSK